MMLCDLTDYLFTNGGRPSLYSLETVLTYRGEVDEKRIVATSRWGLLRTDVAGSGWLLTRLQSAESQTEGYRDFAQRCAKLSTSLEGLLTRYRAALRGLAEETGVATAHWSAIDSMGETLNRPPFRGTLQHISNADLGVWDRWKALERLVKEKTGEELDHNLLHKISFCSRIALLNPIGEKVALKVGQIPVKGYNDYLAGGEVGEGLRAWLLKANGAADPRRPNPLEYGTIQGLFEQIGSFLPNGGAFRQKVKNPFQSLCWQFRAELGNLLGAEDPLHQKRLAEVIAGRPIGNFETGYSVRGRLVGSIYSAQTDRGEPATLMLTGDNGWAVWEQFFAQQNPPDDLHRLNIRRVAANGLVAYMETVTSRAVDLPQVGKGFLDSLAGEVKKLIRLKKMPEKLEDLLCVTADGEACWLFPDEEKRVDLDPAALEKVIVKIVKEDVEQFKQVMKGSGLHLCPEAIKQRDQILRHMEGHLGPGVRKNIAELKSVLWSGPKLEGQ